MASWYQYSIFYAEVMTVRLQNSVEDKTADLLNDCQLVNLLQTEVRSFLLAVTLQSRVSVS